MRRLRAHARVLEQHVPRATLGQGRRHQGSSGEAHIGLGHGRPRKRSSSSSGRPLHAALQGTRVGRGIKKTGPWRDIWNWEQRPRGWPAWRRRKLAAHQAISSAQVGRGRAAEGWHKKPLGCGSGRLGAEPL